MAKKPETVMRISRQVQDITNSLSSLDSLDIPKCENSDTVDALNKLVAGKVVPYLKDLNTDINISQIQYILHDYKTISINQQDRKSYCQANLFLQSKPKPHKVSVLINYTTETSKDKSIQVKININEANSGELSNFALQYQK